MPDLPTLNNPQKIEIYRNSGLIISVSRQIDPAAVTLLKRTIYGTSGVRYQHTNQETKIRSLQNPLFFHLYRLGQLIGTYCLVERPLDIDSQLITAFYGRYLSIDENHVSNGYGRLMKEQAVAFVEQCTQPPILFYSYIEAKNTRSIAISRQQGFESIATLNTYFFRRFSPQKSPGLVVASAEELPAIRSLLNQFYQQHTFKTFDNIGYNQHYFVLKESGQIVAGVQANPICWRFHQIAGIRGWMFMNILPRFGLTRRFFNPTQNCFLALEGIYFEEGRPDLLPALLESVLAHFGQHSAMCEIDQSDPLVPVLISKAMGFLSGFEKDVATHVFIKAVGVSGQRLLTLKPLYTSCFDYT